MANRQRQFEPNIIPQMERMADASRMAAAMMLLNDLGMDQASTELERERVAIRAEAQASLLFDKLLVYEHQQLEVDRERAEALAWMERWPVFQELIVQTLRVDNTLEYARTGQAPEPIIGATVLERYGRQFPDAPDPESYPALLSKAIHSMPAQLQAKVVAWLEMNK